MYGGLGAPASRIATRQGLHLGHSIFVDGDVLTNLCRARAQTTPDGPTSESREPRFATTQGRENETYTYKSQAFDEYSSIYASVQIKSLQIHVTPPQLTS